MKVLLACEYPSLNGGENSLLSILPTLQKNGVQPVVAVPERGDLADAFRALGIATYDFDLSLCVGQDKHLVKRRRLAEIVAETKAEILHANSLSCGRASGYVGQQLQVPTVAHLRDIIRLSKTAVADIARNTTLIAVSKATKLWYESLGVPDSQIDVIHNGVDGELFHPDEEVESLRHELRLEPTTAMVLSVGQIGYRKGWDILLEAAKYVVGSLADVCFVVVGERHSTKQEAIEYERALREAAESGILRGKVRFLGRRDDIPKLMAASTVFVHAARQEPLGRVLLESAACGCCVLATAVGGTTEIFPPDSQSARVVEPDEPRKMARQLISLLKNPAERTILGGNARTRMLNNFTIRGSAEALLEVYARVLRTA